jgi:hypothetical protein
MGTAASVVTSTKRCSLLHPEGDTASRHESVHPGPNYEPGDAPTLRNWADGPEIRGPTYVVAAAGRLHAAEGFTSSSNSLSIRRSPPTAGTRDIGPASQALAGSFKEIH